VVCDNILRVIADIEVQLFNGGLVGEEKEGKTEGNGSQDAHWTGGHAADGAATATFHFTLRTLGYVYG
jgi:hypothetical protein